MQVATEANVQHLPVSVASPDFSSTGLLVDFNKIEAMQSLAETMAGSVVALPAHFRGKPGDCLAVVMQAAQWGMNPFAVAQKTHVVNGALGYEAQLVNAVVQTSGAIDGRFHYEYRGEGNSVECRVGAVIRGEREITWGEWLSAATVTTKNSPLWKTNPKQQLGYLQVKNWARAFVPGAILGVYTPEEIEEPRERDMGPAEVVGRIDPAASRTEAVKAKLRGSAPQVPTLDDVLAAIGKAETPEAMKGVAEMAKNLFSDVEREQASTAYKARLAELKAAATARQSAPVDQSTGEIIDPQGDVSAKFVMTFAEVAHQLESAKTRDDLDAAMDLIQHVADLAQREELGGIVKRRLEAFKKGE